MNKNNLFTTKLKFVLLGTLLVIILGLYFSLQANKNPAQPTGDLEQYQNSTPSPDAVNAPIRNKQIEVQAAQEKNPEKCDQIKGESFSYGPRDEKITLSETEARSQCRLNIQNDITPVIRGG